MSQNEFVEDVTLLEGGALDTEYLGDYEDAQTRRPTPPAGKYTLRMPDSFKFKLSDDKKALQIEVDPLVIVGGEHDGYDRIRFTRVSTRKFKNSNASSAGDVLRNFGIDATQLKSTKDWADTFQALAGQITPAPVYCDWRGWDKVEQIEAKGMKKGFPQNQDGTYQPFLTKKNPATGEEYRVWANLEPTARGFSPVV